MKLEKHGITDVSSTSGDNHHWKIPLSISIFNLHVAVNKRKSYRSYLVFALNTISNENRWVIVTSSIHEPVATVTSYWPIILTLFLWTASSEWRCQPGTFQHGGSLSRYLSQCIASFSCYNRNWSLIRSALSWGGQCGCKRTCDRRPHSCCAGVAEQITPSQTVSWSIPITTSQKHKTSSQKGHIWVIQAIRWGQVSYQELGQSNPSTRWLLNELKIACLFESFNEISNKSSILKRKFLCFLFLFVFDCS